MPDEATTAGPRACFDAAALGPYVSAAAVIHGKGADLTALLETALALAVGAETMGAAAVPQIPIRTYKVTGELSITNTGNEYRTQIGIESGHSIHGPDKMWTESEDPAVALRTRAVLQGLVGRQVGATKCTFYEYNADGTVKFNGTKAVTRTRLKPGSLHVITDDGERIPVNLAGAPGRPSAPSAPSTADADASPARPPFVDAARGYEWLVAQVGAEAAAAAWGGHPKTGPIARTTLAEMRGKPMAAAA